jgi:hypothetical protein
MSLEYIAPAGVSAGRQTAFVMNVGSDQRQRDRHIEMKSTIHVDDFAGVRACGK